MSQKLNKNLFTYEDILHAYMCCRKHKRNSRSANQYERNFTDKLSVLLNEINTKTINFGKYTCFAILSPKPREIWSAPFKDRIIHHLICNEVREEFEKHFIDQSYSCIKNRGQLKCIFDAYKGLRKLSKNFKEDVCYIKLDIQSFFMSINKNILWDIVKEQVEETSLLGWLMKANLFNDITKDCKFRAKKRLKQVPLYKSLFNVNYKEKGLPIGNLTSQFYSNIYLDGLDKYCKHVLKLKYYYRYADDILILIEKTASKNKVIDDIDNYLKVNRGLQLNRKKCIINSAKQGIEFLGARIFYHYVIPTRKIYSRLKQSIKHFKKDIFDQKSLERVNSYIGMLIPFKTRATRTKILSNCELDFIYENNLRRIKLI